MIAVPLASMDFMWFEQLDKEHESEFSHRVVKVNRLQQWERSIRTRKSAPSGERKIRAEYGAATGEPNHWADGWRKRAGSGAAAVVDDLELAVTRMPSGRYRDQDGAGPGGTHVVQEGNTWT